MHQHTQKREDLSRRTSSVASIDSHWPTYCLGENPECDLFDSTLFGRLHHYR